MSHQLDSSIRTSFISQSKYARSFLDKLRMQDHKLTSKPMKKGLKLSAKSDLTAMNEKKNSSN